MQLIRRFSLLSLLFAAWPALAGDLKIDAHLVWGANETQDAKYKSVPPDLAEKLHSNFKWDNYYDITNQTQSIPANESRDFRMSDRCVLKIKNLGNSRVEISCIGQGKAVSKGTHTLKPGHWLALGGNAKDNTAWFVGLRAAEAPLAESR